LRFIADGGPGRWYLFTRLMRKTGPILVGRDQKFTCVIGLLAAEN
jgi:hypothetical protein